MIFKRQLPANQMAKYGYIFHIYLRNHHARMLHCLIVFLRKFYSLCFGHDICKKGEISCYEMLIFLRDLNPIQTFKALTQ